MKAADDGWRLEVATRKTRAPLLDAAVRLERKYVRLPKRRSECQDGAAPLTSKAPEVDATGRSSRFAFRTPWLAFQLIFPKNESWGDGLLEEAAKANTTMVLAVGDAESRCETAGGYVLYRRMGADGMIDKLAVAESWRRRGIGRRLLRAAIDALRAKRCKTVHLLVDVERREARALYDAEGFRTLSTRKDYYREGRDALWMELAL